MLLRGEAFNLVCANDDGDFSPISITPLGGERF